MLPQCGVLGRSMTFILPATKDKLLDMLVGLEHLAWLDGKSIWSPLSLSRNKKILLITLKLHWGVKLLWNPWLWGLCFLVISAYSCHLVLFSVPMLVIFPFRISCFKCLQDCLLVGAYATIILVPHQLTLSVSYKQKTLAVHKKIINSQMFLGICCTIGLWRLSWESLNFSHAVTQGWLNFSYLISISL